MQSADSARGAVIVGIEGLAVIGAASRRFGVQKIRYFLFFPAIKTSFFVYQNAMYD